MTTQTSTWHGEPPSDPRTTTGRAAPGAVIGNRYQLRTAIGNGGMGTVWHAVDTVLHRDVAVKEVLLPPEMAAADREAMIERTMREARAAAALSHPSVVQVFDVVTQGGRPWIVMELLHARSLADIIISEGPMAPRAVAKIGIALLGALEVAHAAGVLHRDVKPANVLICTDGRCVLTDFGVARLPSESNLTTPGMVLGSPHFISPERAVGNPFGPPSDLFSLGVSLYTAAEGRPPFDKGDPFETMRAVVEDQPTPPILAGQLTPVLYGLLEKDPARRWDVRAARDALRALLSGPLANRSAMHVTDPYAVMQNATPPSWAPTQPSGPPPLAGKIGGRAMLAPGESIEDRLAGGASPAPDGAARAALEAGPAGAAGAAGAGTMGAGAAGMTSPALPPLPMQPSSPYGYAGRRRRLDDPAGPDATEIHPMAYPAHQPTIPAHLASPPAPPGTYAPADPAGPPGYPVAASGYPTAASGYPGAAVPGGPGGYPAGAATGAPGGPGGYLVHQPTAAFGAPGAAAVTPGAPPAGATQPIYPQQPSRGAGMPAGPGTPAGPGYGGVPGSAGTIHGRSGLLGTIGRWPRALKLGLAAGAAVLLVVVAMSLSNGGGGAAPSARKQQAEPSQPSIPVQHYQGAGFTVDVPAGWKAAKGATFIDFVDPDNPGRWVRLGVEKAGDGVTGRSVLEGADRRFTNGIGCAGYQRIGLTDITLAGHPGAQLEYTCAPTGSAPRHGLWQVIVWNGKSYGLTLSVPESTFAASKPIMDEMVSSFTLSG